MTLRFPPLISRHVYASTANMKRCLRLFTFKTYAPPLFHHLLQHFLSETFRLPACDSSSPISSFQELPVIDKRYPLSSSMAYLDIFDRLHHPISALCIHCGLFFLLLHCTRLSSGFFFFCVFTSSSPSSLSFLHSLNAVVLSFLLSSSCFSLTLHFFFLFHCS